ncbi:MAG TPA: hypothetical protein VJ890_29375 [Vineibacter sp.]|nr:hypothetical protein [Vineibacter sp.]
MNHGFAVHGRDYVIVIQLALASRHPGTYELTFTHVVELAFETRVRDDVWPTSWSDEFIDYSAWLTAGEPDGYVWGCNWSLAYPGITALASTPKSEEWTRRLGKDMFQMSIETDRFCISLVFHDVRIENQSDDASIVSQVILPLS